MLSFIPERKETIQWNALSQGKEEGNEKVNLPTKDSRSIQQNIQK